MTEFISPYKSKYTVPKIKERKSEFVSEYAVKKTECIISGKTRSKKQKFTSRLVSK